MEMPGGVCRMGSVGPVPSTGVGAILLDPGLRMQPMPKQQWLVAVCGLMSVPVWAGDLQVQRRISYCWLVTFPVPETRPNPIATPSPRGSAPPVNRVGLPWRSYSMVRPCALPRVSMSTFTL
jgi:hypothetical protein